MNATRFITNKANKVLPVGRVQTAVLSAIFDRCNKINNFKPEKYYLELINKNKTNKEALKNGRNSIWKKDRNILPNLNDGNINKLNEMSYTNIFNSCYALSSLFLNEFIFS